MRTTCQRLTVSRHRHRLGVRLGFTLVELVAAMGIMTVLMAGMGSAIMIAGHAIPNGRTPPEITAESRNILDRMTEDLLYATSVTEKTATAVTFTVADRNHGAAGAETIRYAWSATPGDPLTLEYNGAAAVNLVEDVQEFALTYAVDLGAAAAVPGIELAEELFLQQDSFNSGIEANINISASVWVAESFIPTLPIDAVSWRVSRVQFLPRPTNPADGNMSVSVRADSGSGEPGVSAVDQVVVPEADFVAGVWYEVTFANAGGLDPSQGYSIVFSGFGGSTVGSMKIGTSSTGSPDTRYFLGNGGTWAEDPTSDIWMWVWGKATVPDPNPPLPSEYWLSSVQIALQIGTDASTKTQTEVQVLNAPDISGL